MASINRPKNPCTNPHCGSTWFKPSYDFVDGVSVPVWECVNCPTTQPRKTVHRRTNGKRALDAREELKQAWKPVDDLLALACDAGQPNGCVLAYGSSFNYHMDALLGVLPGARKFKMSNFDVRYHAGAARKDLEQAKIFVARYAKIAYA